VLFLHGYGVPWCRKEDSRYRSRALSKQPPPLMRVLPLGSSKLAYLLSTKKEARSKDT
jgi:hypothetical protein